jgi:AcrR family transcriptional regulator
MTIAHEKNELARRRARTKVLGKAAELFGRYGFHAVSVRQITREAGVAFQSMYTFVALKASAGIRRDRVVLRR